jgi:hypothetical protein
MKPKTNKIKESGISHQMFNFCECKISLWPGSWWRAIQAARLWYRSERENKAEPESGSPGKYREIPEAEPEPGSPGKYREISSAEPEPGPPGKYREIPYRQSQNLAHQVNIGRSPRQSRNPGHQINIGRSPG